MIDIDRPQWSQRGLCNTGDAALLELFFPRSEMPSADDRAKQICAECPVASECLDYALELSENPWGVWGGLSKPERMPLRRERHGNPMGFAPRPIECGTHRGYTAHHRRGEQPCPACSDASNRYQQFIRPSRSTVSA